MGTIKSDLRTQIQNEIALAAQAMANPARVAIIQYLSVKNSGKTSEIVEAISLSQPTVSEHLKRLRKSGIIKGKIEGNTRSYYIDPIKWNEIKKAFLDLFESFDQHLLNQK